MNIVAVIPTGNRPKEYQSVIDWCYDHNVTPITIATSEEADKYAVGAYISNRELNISKWWNLGIQRARQDFNPDYILVLNDDVQLPEGWLRQMVAAMLATGSSGASGQRGGKNLISGYAFILDAYGTDADENLVWWYGDDDIQRQCELADGFYIVPNIRVKNLYGNSSVSRFAEQIEKDRIFFEQKWSIK